MIGHHSVDLLQEAVELGHDIVEDGVKYLGVARECRNPHLYGGDPCLNDVELVELHEVDKWARHGRNELDETLEFDGYLVTQLVDLLVLRRVLLRLQERLQQTLYHRREFLNKVRVVTHVIQRLKRVLYHLEVIRDYLVGL
jgi:hypothetical protein